MIRADPIPYDSSAHNYIYNNSIVEGFTFPSKPTLHTVRSTDIISVRFRRAEIPVDAKAILHI